MSDFVIDASVALKWVVDEDGTKEALTLRRARLFAPDLINVECANILWKKARLGQLSAEEALFAGRLLANADMALTPTRLLLEPSIALAIQLDHPAYDCAYLALAEAKDIAFVTADSRLVRKVQSIDRFKGRLMDLRDVPAI